MAFLRRSIFAACLLVAGTATSAVAGGSFGYPVEPVVPVPAPIPIPDYGNSFYLRGDFGWALHENPDIGVPGLGYSNDDLDDTWSLGVGFGYNFRDNFRGDITLDYRFDAEASATDAGGDTHRADLSSIVGLVNVYYDFRGRDRFTPYVGGGIGVTFNETDDHTVSTGGTSSGKGTTEFAAALMAGFSYRMNSWWMFDAGYRYLFLGDAETKSSGATGKLLIDDIRAHELRVGVRYEFQ